MAKFREGSMRRRTSRNGSAIMTDGSIRPFFQPIVDLRNGRVSGFEALARRIVGDRVAAPCEFLPGIPADERLALFRSILDQALGSMTTALDPGAGYYVTINVERRLFLDAAFFAVLQDTLRAWSYPPRQLVLEILEDDRIEDESALIASLRGVRDLGIRVALDDIGTAHASLINIKNLPVDILKLDQSFARELAAKPHDLQFVLSLLSLARGLDKSLVIEGVETVEILDALMILGIEFAQGYGIARPMPPDRLQAWIDTYRVPVATRSPQSLLGAFASHLSVIETCRILMHQPLPIAWKEECRNPHTCEIGRYFDRCGMHETSFGLAHKRFHEVMTLYGSDYSLWKSGADGFAEALALQIGKDIETGQASEDPGSPAPLEDEAA